MTASQELIDGFKQQWANGERPSPEAVLATIPDQHEREDARRQLEDYLASAPTPRYADTTLAALRAEPAVTRAASIFDNQPEPFGSLVHRLRWERELRLEQIAEQLTERLDLPRRPGKVTRYLHDLEHGLLNPQRLSRTLLDSLAAILGTATETLRAAATQTGLTGRVPAGQFQRSYENQPPFSHIPPGYHPPESDGGERDRIDELFDPP